MGRARRLGVGGLSRPVKGRERLAEGRPAAQDAAVLVLPFGQGRDAGQRVPHDAGEHAGEQPLGQRVDGLDRRHVGHLLGRHHPVGMHHLQVPVPKVEASRDPARRADRQHLGDPGRAVVEEDQRHGSGVVLDQHPERRLAGAALAGWLVVHNRDFEGRHLVPRGFHDARPGAAIDDTAGQVQGKVDDPRLAPDQAIERGGDLGAHTLEGLGRGEERIEDVGAHGIRGASPVIAHHVRRAKSSRSGRFTAPAYRFGRESAAGWRMMTINMAAHETDGAERRGAARPYPESRDPRIDLLRGFALLTIFVDHIPLDSLSRFTLRSFGFSDAAELFVFLAGYSAFLAYRPVFQYGGWWVGWKKIGRRCATLWAVHALLLAASFGIVMVRGCLTAEPLPCLGPFLAAGFSGLVRGLTLQGLPSYLDILPLYIVLLAVTPLILFGLRRSVGATVAASLVLQALAVHQGWNLPSQIDVRTPATAWTFNPLAWQSVFVLGAAMACGRQRGWGWLSKPPRALKLACIAILLFGVLAVDPWHLWPDFAATLFPRAALSDDWKVSAPPWRLLHGLALLLLLLSSRRVGRLAVWPGFAAVRACGRAALPVFAAGCMLALLGRIAFVALGPTPAVQIAVNIVGLLAQLALGARLQRHRSGAAARPKRVAAVPRLNMLVMGPSWFRTGLAFLFGAALLLGPAVAYLSAAKAGRHPPARHDYATPPNLGADRRFRIVAFGSSSTRGYGASQEAAAYPAQLQAIFDAAAQPGARFAIFNRGINGDDINGMSARIDDDILPRHPALVVWQLGSNDALHDVTPDHFETILRAGVTRLRAAGSAVVLIGPQWNPDPDRRTLFEAMNAAVATVGREAGIPVVDRYGMMRRWIGNGAFKPTELIGPDGLHLTDRGYALMARAVFETLVTRVPIIRAHLQGVPPSG